MRKPLALAILTLLGSTAFAAGEVVYRWRDANGVWNYSDQPHPGAELMSKTSIPAPAVTNEANAANAKPTTPAAGASTPAAQTPDSDLPVSKEVAQQVRLDATQAKAKRCEKAKADYEEKVQALRMTKTDAKGNVTFADAAEMDKARLDARALRDLACAP